MLKIIISICALMVISVNAEDLKGYRCVSNGLRQPLKWGKASQPRIFSRYRRKAMVDLKGKLKLVFPTYHMSKDKPIREIPFPNDVEIEAGIEPSFKMSNKNLESSPRIVGNKVIYRKGDPATYKIITVDLGDTVIKKGEWFGIWVALENLDGENAVPMSRVLGDRKKQIYECSYTSAGTSFIKDNFIRTAKKMPKIPLKRNWVIGFGPVAILAKTAYKGDVWAIIGSSIPEGYYDVYGNQYGDENANLGYADKLVSTHLGCPSVNLAKGSDRFQFCAEQLKGRFDILKICDVTKVHVGLGGNDIAGRRKLKHLKTDCQKIVKQIKDFNPQIEVVGSTILPRSKSTDDFKTIEKQTALYQCGGHDSVRGKWNKLMRTNPTSVWLDNVHELCSRVEYNWKDETALWAPLTSTPKAYTPDGVHPSCAGSNEIAKHATPVFPDGCKK